METKRDHGRERIFGGRVKERGRKREIKIQEGGRKLGRKWKRRKKMKKEREREFPPPVRVRERERERERARERKRNSGGRERKKWRERERTRERWREILSLFFFSLFSKLISLV